MKTENLQAKTAVLQTMLWYWHCVKSMFEEMDLAWYLAPNLLDLLQNSIRICALFKIKFKIKLSKSQMKSWATSHDIFKLLMEANYLGMLTC